MIQIFVPGRLCLFGEHSDWAGALRQSDLSISPGACILTGTNQGIQAHAESASRFEMVSRLPDGTSRGPLVVEMNEGDLATATAARSFFSYAAGVAAEISRRYHTPGVRIVVTQTSLPIARGLSSSAAICVLTARAFNQVHQLGLDVRAEMELAYRGELATGSLCGRMDQACAYGQRVVQLTFAGDAMTVELLTVERPIHLMIVDLLHAKDTRRILADLHTVFGASVDPRQPALRSALGDLNLQLIRRARVALASGDAAVLGELMQAAQDLFDRAVAPACPSELRAPRLHALLAEEAVRELTWGGKGVGSQGDGAAQLVCRDADAQAALERYLSSSRDVRCLPLSIAPHPS